MADKNISESAGQSTAKGTDKKRGKIFIQTHGCQMNEYDSAKMADVLNDANGMELTDNAEEADVLLLNTCSIREKAKRKFFINWVAGEKSKRKTLMSLLGLVVV